MFKKIAILTSRYSWFVPHAIKFAKFLRKKNFICRVFSEYKDIPQDFEVVFVLSYFKIIKKIDLEKHKHNIVVHESGLPKGRGWAPLFWQILEGRSKIPVVLFEAKDETDSGPIYMKDYIKFKGHELYQEIRHGQAEKTLELCARFLYNYDKLKMKAQKGKPTFYKRRTPENGKMNINKTLKDQFNLLRITDNDNFPAFFFHRGHKYMVKIYKERLV